tara:strand:- start:956 stop:1192 length:237 start_codon:yes stop_codon:yes gene_type:complete
LPPTLTTLFEAFWCGASVGSSRSLWEIVSFCPEPVITVLTLNWVVPYPQGILVVAQSAQLLMPVNDSPTTTVVHWLVP